MRREAALARAHRAERHVRMPITGDRGNQTDFRMPTVLSLRRCACSTCTSCVCFVLLRLGLCGRFVAAAVGAFGTGCPVQRNGEWFIGGLSPRVGNGPLEFLCMRSALAQGSKRTQIAEQRTLLCPSLTLRRALELLLACTKTLH
jgi:hypothetical protein